MTADLPSDDEIAAMFRGARANLWWCWHYLDPITGRMFCGQTLSDSHAPCYDTMRGIAIEVHPMRLP